MLMVSGSQADRRERNKITLLKLSEVHKTKGPKEDGDSENEDDDDDEDDDLDDDPTIEAITVAHSGCVNRIRAMPQRPGIVASMADTQSAHIFDLTASVRSMLAGGPRVTPSPKPAFTFGGH